jgi:hypothetical protein
MSIKDVKCELYGMTFATQEEKEEYKKLEHKEHREPSGVSLGSKKSQLLITTLVPLA